MYAIQANSLGLAWGGKCHRSATGCHLFDTPGDIFSNFCCFQHLSLRYTREINLFLHKFYPFDCDSIKCEIST